MGDRRLLVAVALLALIAFPVAARLAGAGIVDDAYIFLRYAGNVAAGHGPVFNPGERVEGYTSPLWLAVLSLAAALPIDPPRAAMVLSTVAAAAAILLVALLGRGIVRRPFLLAAVALFLATNPTFVYWGSSGMESSLFTLLFVTATLLFARRLESGSLLAPGFLLLLLTWARPDGLALAAAFLVPLAWRHRREPAAGLRRALTLLAPLLLLVPHLLWRHRYYGSWLPNTYQAKAALPARLLLERGLEYSRDFLLGHHLYLLAAAVVLVPLLRRRRLPLATLPLAAVTLTWIAAVTLVGGDHFAMYRFFMPVMPLLALLAAVAADRLLPEPPGQPWPRAPIVVLVAAAVVAANLALHRAQGGARARKEVELARAWAKVGHWLHRWAPAGATLASPVVGAIPYHAGLPTIDLLGLTDRTIAGEGRIYPDGAIGHQRYHTDYVLARRPTYVIYPSSGRFREPVLARPEAIAESHFFALRDLALDPRTQALYRYRVEPLADGTVVEMLELRTGAAP